MFYTFLQHMWQQGKIDEAYLSGQVEKGRITEEEKRSILSKKQILAAV